MSADELLGRHARASGVRLRLTTTATPGAIASTSTSPRSPAPCGFPIVVTLDAPVFDITAKLRNQKACDHGQHSHASGLRPLPSVVK
jgi:hypothetical protein